MFLFPRIRDLFFLSAVCSAAAFMPTAQEASYAYNADLEWHWAIDVKRSNRQIHVVAEKELEPDCNRRIFTGQLIKRHDNNVYRYENLNDKGLMSTVMGCMSKTNMLTTGSTRPSLIKASKNGKVFITAPKEFTIKFTTGKPDSNSYQTAKRTVGVPLPRTPLK